MMTAHKKTNAKSVTNRQHKQRGYSLIELSVAVIVIGFVVTILANIYPKITESTAKQQSKNQSQKLEKTILGFVFATGRLPCPAANISGVEDCSLEKGELPYRTLGLATPVRNQAGVALRYAVFDKALTSSADMELTALKDRYEAYIATDDNSVDLRPVAQQTILNTGNPNSMDMCQALLSGSQATNDATKLHTGSGASLKHIAYLIHDLGLEDADNLNGLFDGSNTATATD
ncbi:MAG: type II secretion system protein, partial [Thiomicrorhabdus sp.]|nr:type II secretion system protein [Thiomicrorhabdus sp.]